MALREQLEADLKTAMKQGDTVTRDVIRYTLSGLKYAEIEKGGSLDATEEIAFLQREAKRRGESIEQFTSGGRPNLVEKETAELQVLQRYLPAQLDDQELHAIVQAAIAEAGATSVRDMGKVMPIAIREIAGRADGKRISDAVKAGLAESG